MIKKYARAFYQSFYKPEIYREALIGWQGFGGKYMLFVSAIISVFLSVTFVIELQKFKKEELPFITAQIPAITIENGELSTDSGKATTIHNREKTMAIVIDPKKSAKQFMDEKVIVGIGKNFFVMRNKDGGYRNFPIQETKGKIKFDKENLKRLWENGITLMSVICYPLFILSTLLPFVLTAVVVAFLSYIVTAYMTEEYDFVTRMRLAALAQTPAQIIALILQATINHTAASWFVPLIACLYTYVMIILIRRLPPPIVAAEEI